MAQVLTSYTSATRQGSGLFASLGAALARRRVYNRTLEELRGLTDRELADLGISRFSIAQVAHEAAYGK